MALACGLLAGRRLPLCTVPCVAPARGRPPCRLGAACRHGERLAFGAGAACQDAPHSRSGAAGRRPPAPPPVLRPARPDRPAGCTMRAGAWMSWQTAGAARAQRSPRPAGSHTRCLVDPHANRMLDAAYRCALGGGAAPSPGMLGRAASEAALEENVRAGPPAGRAAHRLAGGEPARRAGPAGDEDARMALHRRVRHRAACRPARPV